MTPNIRWLGRRQRSVLLGLYLSGPSNTIYPVARKEVDSLVARGLVRITPNKDVALTQEGEELMHKEFPDGA